jgi:N-acetyl-anhydromuramyl-L-alanine amidase AmpD
MSVIKKGNFLGAVLLGGSIGLIASSAWCNDNSSMNLRSGRSGSWTRGTRENIGDYAQVREAQQALKDKGYDPGHVDGVIDSQTRAAISAFQGHEGLAVTGTLDVETADQLGVSDHVAKLGD